MKSGKACSSFPSLQNRGDVYSSGQWKFQPRAGTSHLIFPKSVGTILSLTFSYGPAECPLLQNSPRVVDLLLSCFV